MRESITVFVGSAIETVDPHYAISFAEHTVVNTLHTGLTTYDEDGRLSPGLAQSWVISNDGRTYTFALKPDLTWSDGSRLTSLDIITGVKRSLDPARLSPFAAKLFSVASAEAYTLNQMIANEALGVVALDDQTIVFTLGRRDDNFLHVLAHPVAKPAPADNPNLLETGRVTSGDYSIQDIAAPKRLMRRDGTQELVFEAVASVQDVWLRVETEGPFVTINLPIVSVPSVGDRAAFVKRSGGQGLYAYAVNMARAPLNTLEVRHALAMSIDRSAILEGIGIPGLMAATHFVPQSAKTYGASYTAPFASLTFEEREAVAAALLSEQGYGVSNRLVIRLRVPKGDVHESVAQRVAEMWAAAGIDTEIIAAPLPEHWQALEIGDFDIAFASWPGPQNTPRVYLEPLSQFGGPWNFARYQFLNFTELLIRAGEGRDEDARADQYREAEKALIEDQSLLALFFYTPLAIVSPELEGWQENPAGLHPVGMLEVREENEGLNLIPALEPFMVP